MKKVLITGGLGFIGSYLADLCLERGYDVTVMSRSDRKLDNIRGIRDRVTVLVMDVKDVGHQVKGFDIIFHLAGSTDNYAIIEGEPFRDIEQNCTCTIALLEAIKEHNPGARLVFASTFFVNGRPGTLPVTVDSACNPLGLYGATRLAAEHFCRIYHNVFDLDIVIARFTNVFGPRELADNKKKAGFNYMINLAVEGKELKLYGNGDFFRDYIYVTDVAGACMVIAEKGAQGSIYYVSRGEYVKFSLLIGILVALTGAQVSPVSPPDFHKRVGITDFVADNSPLMALGWVPRVSLEEGIAKTVEYYRKIREGKG